MKLLYIAMLAGLPLAGVAAWRIGGAAGTGVMLGCGVAVAIGLGSIAWQEHLMRTRPSFALNALLAGFLAKLTALLGGALALRFVAPAAQWASPTTYLLGFAAASLWVMTIGAFRHMRSWRAAREPSTP